MNVPNVRAGMSTLPGFTAAMCIFDPMSMAAAPELTGFNSGRLSVVVLGLQSGSRIT